MYLLSFKIAYNIHFLSYDVTFFDGITCALCMIEDKMLIFLISEGKVDISC